MSGTQLVYNDHEYPEPVTVVRLFRAAITRTLPFRVIVSLSCGPWLHIAKWKTGNLAL
jgi:hypothetical protein